MNTNISHLNTTTCSIDTCVESTPLSTNVGFHVVKVVGDEALQSSMECSTMSTETITVAHMEMKDTIVAMNGNTNSHATAIKDESNILSTFHKESNNDRITDEQCHHRQSDVNSLLLSIDSSSYLVSVDTSVSSSGDDDYDDILFPNNTERAVVIANKESKEVNNFKISVYVLLFVSAIVVSVCVFYFIQNDEHKEFEHQYYMDADKVLEAIGNSIDRTLMPLDSLSIAFISHSLYANETWPFVTLPDFGLRVAKSLPLMGAMMVQVLNIVEPKLRNKWEGYAKIHNSWVNDNLQLQGTWNEYFGAINYDWDSNDYIHSDEGYVPQNVSRLMAPQWQIFPTPTRLSYAYNWDWLSMLDTTTLYRAMEQVTSVLGLPYLLDRPDNPEAQAESEGWIDYYSDFLPKDENVFEPAFDIIYPIIDDIGRVNLFDNGSHDNKTVVGLLAASLYFREMYRDILPPESNGMIIVTENPCTTSFTYQINGPNVSYLGVNDNHDTTYDKYVVAGKFSDLKKYRNFEAVYTGVPLDEEYCPYTVYLYPSNEMKALYTSNKPVTYLIVTLVGFAFLAIVFVVYNFKVEQRQKKVLSTAVRSTEIVSSLFPQSVHQQLYSSNVDANTTSNIENFEASGGSGYLGKNDKVNPIATLYPETTIMFADIKGFTAWSSTREPMHVFQLLETLYGKFDEIAKSLGVFKVETIGDTYVAVVGLPQTRKHHAVIMAKFARKCIDAMATITQSLAKTLGTGTTSLTLRVGLNSGPTTAGVLRGERARFQLFGDTVNTASRMESTGECSKIQVSESTALLIQKSGRGHWLSLRPDQIMAKGKGQMQTYWCDPSTPKNQGKGNIDSDSCEL